VILVDGDVIAYRCAFKCENEEENAACYTTGSYLSELLSNLFMLIEEEHPYKVYLTGKGNFRNDIAVTAPYKGNRKDKEKPFHLDAIREYLISDWAAVVSEGEEADDLIAIEHSKQETPIIVSTDKDFDQLAGFRYNPNSNELFHISEERATRFFYQQILMGDRVDNIIGIKGIGPKKSEAMLEGLSEIEMYNLCVEKLGEERVLENGRLLWLRREEGQLWEPPVEKD